MAKREVASKKPARRVAVKPLSKATRPPATSDSMKWSHIVAKAWADEKFRKRLVDNPASVLEEQGWSVPAGVEVRVVESTDKVQYLTLPARPAGGVQDLTTGQMKAIVGGIGGASPTKTPRRPVGWREADGFSVDCVW